MTNKNKKKIVKLPPPGLDGSYRGSCIVCFCGTDTGLALAADFEAVPAFLLAVGVSRDQAMATADFIAQTEHRCAPGEVPDGPGPWKLRVCEGCAPAGMRPRPVALGLPVYAPPGASP